MIIGFEQSSYAVMEGYNVSVCFDATVQGTVNTAVMISVSTIDDTAIGK